MAVPEQDGNSTPENRVGTDQTLFRYRVQCPWFESGHNSSLGGRILVIRREEPSMCIYCEGYEEETEEVVEDSSKAVDARHQPAASSSAGVFTRVRNTLSGVFHKE